MDHSKLMRESTASKDHLNSSSDQDRSFERTRGSYIACINRSLEHAFEFLSETGYASGGISDAERVESRSEDELDRTQGKQSDLLTEINSGLKEYGMTEIKIPSEEVKAYKPGRLWGVNEKFVCSKKDTENLNSKNRILKTVSEEKINVSKSGQKIILFQHVNVERPRRNASKSMENIGPKRGLKSVDVGAGKRLENRTPSSSKQIENTRPCHGNKENSVPLKKLHEREDSGYESKAESRHGVMQNGINHGLKKNVAREKNPGEEKNARSLSESDRRESTPYLTTEREILKQILTNAKESEQLQKKHRRSSRSLSNLDLRRAASKISLGPSQRQRTPLTGPNNEQKGFKKFRESFRKTTSYFIPHKFAVQEEKGNESDCTNALEFQYHNMRESRDGNEPITSSKNLTGKKKGFFRHIFERKRQPQESKHRLRSFRSTEAISQSRWHSKENLARKAERPKSISMLIDKVKDPFDDKNADLNDVRRSQDDKKQARRNSFSKGSRFRRSESLRSIPSTSGFGDAVLRPNENESSEPIRILKCSRNRPMSVHGLLLRASSFDPSESKVEDPQDLHRVLRNRLSCCSTNENTFHNVAHSHRDIDLTEAEEAPLTSSSPRKDDDITEWIRGLRFTSKNSSNIQHHTFDEQEENRIEEEAELIDHHLDDYAQFFHETRIVNGQIQTYL